MTGESCRASFTLVQPFRPVHGLHVRSQVGGLSELGSALVAPERLLACVHDRMLSQMGDKLEHFQAFPAPDAPLVDHVTGADVQRQLRGVAVLLRAHAALKKVGAVLDRGQGCLF